MTAEGRKPYMIRSEAEYQAALKRIDEDQAFARRQRAELEAKGYTAAQVDRGMEATLSFQAQLAEEVDWYEKARRREIAPLANFAQVGRLLIALRLANNFSQRGLADRLGVSEASVSRDERNEYHGITVERAQRVLEALGETTTTVVADTPARTLVAA